MDTRGFRGQGRAAPRADFDTRFHDATVTPTRWSARGEALVPGGARGDLLVWQGIPGETAAVQVVHRGRHQSLALWQATRSPSALRVEPPCPRYTTCGGCPLMHVAQEGQDRGRRALVERALEEEGVSAVLAPTVPAPGGTQGFRHVLKLLAGIGPTGRWRLGAPGRTRREVVPVPECLIVTPALRRLTASAAHHFVNGTTNPWVDGRGTLRWLVARESSTTGEILLTLISGQWHPSLQELGEAISKDHPEVAGVHVHFNDEPGNAIFSHDEEGHVRTRKLGGADVITETVAGVTYLVGPGDFYQTQPAMAARLVDDVLALAQVEPGVPLVDLYCGVGGFALAAAKRSGWAMGVEGMGGAVARAREAANRNRLDCEFQARPVVEALAELGRRLASRRPVVVVDPARRGLEEGVVEGLDALAPRALLMVSCNARAFARDAAALEARGWKLSFLRPYDMFPHTMHVELLARFEPPASWADRPEGRAPRRRVVA